MNPIERVNAVLAGRKPDRAPFSFWYHFPPEQAAGFQAPLPGNEAPLGCDDNWVQQADFADAVGQGSQIAQFLPIAEPDLYFLNPH